MYFFTKGGFTNKYETIFNKKGDSFSHILMFRPQTGKNVPCSCLLDTFLSQLAYNLGIFLYFCRKLRKDYGKSI